MTASSQKLVVTIRNDGIPFSPPRNPKARMGLRTMNYRANTIGASFDIKPHREEGTIVTCVLPLKNAAKHRNGLDGGEGKATTNGDVAVGKTSSSVVASAQVLA
jgi:signal transduction histidine kinase